MPKILEKRVKALQDAGKTKQQAYAIATASLQKEGKLAKGTQKLTAKGKKTK